MIALACPHCQAKLRVKDELAGKRVRCSTCREPFEVRAIGDATRAAEPAAAITASERAKAPALPRGPLTETATMPPGPADSMPSHGTIGQDDGAEGATLPPAPNRGLQQALHKPKVGERYRIEDEIGRGGMGAVMRALDQDIRREVAVKYLLQQADDRQQARFIEEAQITGQLEHPNIVPIHDLGVDGAGQLYFSMKIVKGRSLAEILKDEKNAYTLGRWLTIFVNVCNAMAYAHSRKVIHRDLKPANIMVGDFGEVYVMDWGLAKVLGKKSAVSKDEPPTFSREPTASAAVATDRLADANLTQAGSIMGTPAYMPPEQAMGEGVDQRSDIYSLGAILYEILTLSPPVGRGGDPMSVLLRVIEGAIQPPEKQAPKRAQQGHIPAELSAIALKALAKEPGDRYQSVEALQRDVQLYLEGRSVSAKRDTAWELLKKLVKRNKGASIATAAALVLLSAVVGVAFHFNYEERLKAEEARVQADKARAQAEDNHQAFLKEQEEKHARTKHSAPAFLRAAQLMTNEKQFDDALAQVNVALDYDPEQTAGWLLKGQLLIGLERYAEAAAPLQEFVNRTPEDALAQKLAKLAGQPEPEQAAYLWSLWEVFDKQQALPLARHMAQLAERFAGPGKELLAAYRKQIDAVPGWAGKGKGMFLDKNGKLSLSFAEQRDVRDLTPLKGMKLSSLNLYRTPVQDLAPLQGMPLTWLSLDGCTNVQDLGPLRDMPLTWLNLFDTHKVATLEPLRGMKLTWLNMHGLSKVATLEPLKDMPLQDLSINFCYGIPDLEPLRGMPLKELHCFSYNGLKIRSLEPLTGMKLKKLNLGRVRLIKDIGPLRDMPLEWLNLEGVPEVDDFEPLRDRPLTYLNLWATRIGDLSVLKNMPLKYLNLIGCRNVKDLTPLAELPLTVLELSDCAKVEDVAPLADLPLAHLNLAKTAVRDLTPLTKMKKLTDLRLYGCKQIEDFQPVRDMHLTAFGLDGCTQLRDLEVVRGLKELQHLRLQGCNHIDDLSPLAGMQLRSIALTPRFIQKGWEALWNMNSLDNIEVEGRGVFRVADFRKLHEKGGFK